MSSKRVLILRIAILGIGSIGGMLLGALADSGVELIAVSKGYMASQISERGLTLNTPEGTVEHFPSELFTVIDSESIPIPINLANSCDFALICGKSHSTPILTQLASELLSKEGIAISLQNGLGHSEYLSKKLDKGAYWVVP